MIRARPVFLAAALVAALSFVSHAQTAIGPDGFNAIRAGGVDVVEERAGVSISAGRVGVDPTIPTFELVAGATSPNNLPDTLTMGGTAMDLVLSLNGADVNGATAAARNQAGALTLTEAGAGASPAQTTLSPFHGWDSTERGMLITTGGKRYATPAAATLDITTEDFVVEFVSTTLASGGVIIDKSLASTDGWKVVEVGGATVRLSLRTASVTTNVDATSSGSSTSTSKHFIFFVDRDEATTNGAIAYQDGSPGSGVNMSARAASMANAVVGAIGANSGGAGTAQNTAAIRVWKCPAATPQCMPGGASNPTAWAPIARERAAVAFGLSPTIANGSKSPTTLTRNSTAFTDIIDGTTRAIWSMGTHAPRVARRGAGGVAVVGYLSEPQTSNIWLQSEALSTSVNDTFIDVGDNVLANAYVGPNRALTGDSIDGDNTGASEHGVRQAVTLTATTYTLSAWAKAGTQSVVALRDNTVANAHAFFNLTTCAACAHLDGNCAAAVGTTGAGVSQAWAQPWHVDADGDGTADTELCRIAIAFTGTVASHSLDVLCAASDGVLTYTDADAAADCGFTGVETEAFPMPTSYQVTTTAASTRTADDLRFSGASHYTGSPSTMDVSFLCPPLDAIAVGPNLVFSVGVAGTDYASLSIAAAGDVASFFGRVSTTQWSASGASDIADGAVHSLRQTMVTDDVNMYADAAFVAQDTLASVPTVASSNVGVGVSATGGNSFGCLLSRARLWSSIQTPAAVP